MIHVKERDRYTLLMWYANLKRWVLRDLLEGRKIRGESDRARLTKKLFKKNIPFSPAPPEVKVSGRHVDINKESVLSCLITGFYPADIDIKWFKEDKIMDHVSENTPQRNPIGTYSVTSTVTITPTEEDKHRTFSCRVQHEARNKPLQLMGDVFFVSTAPEYFCCLSYVFGVFYFLPLSQVVSDFCKGHCLNEP
uniref:Ig-like domain-containing protein n=1 Tax=Leptobrachium leishanense TaxID=445787 RepID=A0A8C5Q009_9ANUR